MLFYEPDARDLTVLAHNPFKALVAPRPIGWISAMDARGQVNLAPYRFKNRKPPSAANVKTAMALAPENGALRRSEPRSAARTAGPH
jgi:hypothetical protein